MSENKTSQNEITISHEPSPPSPSPRQNDDFTQSINSWLYETAIIIIDNRYLKLFISM